MIMVIDEQVSNMNTFLEMMKNQPFQLEIKQGLEGTEKKVLELKPDLIVMDLSSNFSTKRDACEKILKHKQLHSKFLFIVPSSFPELLFVPAERLGGFIKKPYYLGDVLGKVHSVLYDEYTKQIAT
jgi:response regulator RpfG family c-di-GMP phosphodiesterase